MKNKPQPAFAFGTRVSVDRSRTELEAIIQKYAGSDAAFSYGRSAGQVAIQFEVPTPKGLRQVRFSLALPKQADAAQVVKRRRNAARIEDWIEKETQRLWRCLVLQVKARFVELSMALPGEDFDSIFLAHIVGKDQRTIYEILTSGDGPKLLTSFAEGKK